SLESPYGGEKWSRSHPISWSAYGDTWSPADTVTLEYTSNAGASYNSITDGIPYITSPLAAWNTLSAGADSAIYKIRISADGGPSHFAEDLSGLFTVDNTPPHNVGCSLPPLDSIRESLSTPLTALGAGDSPAGLAGQPYYFQIDVTPGFDSPSLQNSGWRSYRTWLPVLQPNTTYYWRVNARDAADPTNESGFCGDVDTPGTSWWFRTIGVYHALDIESETVGLRWILDNYDIAPGDIVYVDAGSYSLSDVLVLNPDDGGSEDAQVKIIADGGKVILDAGGGINALEIAGDWFEVAGFAFTGATDAGLLITGDHNQVSDGEAYGNGGAGIEATGDYTVIRNMLSYANGAEGILLGASRYALIENNTCADNGTRQLYVADIFPAWSVHTMGSTDCTAINNILTAAGAGAIAIQVDGESAPGWDSDYNDIHAPAPAVFGVWAGTAAAGLGQWQDASFGDFSSLGTDPLFVGSGDYHPQSTEGSYHGGTWGADTGTSPVLDCGSPAIACLLETSPNGGRTNLGAYGNTVEASRSSAGGGTNYYVNDSSTQWDVYCSTAGLPWPAHDGLSSSSPLNSLETVFNNHTIAAGDVIYVDTGVYPLLSETRIPVSGTALAPVILNGSANGSVMYIQNNAPSCFYLTNRQFIVLNSFRCFNASANGIHLAGSTNIALNRCDIRGSLQSGIHINNAIGGRIYINDSEISYNNTYGIDAATLTQSATLHIAGNTIHNNNGQGIYLLSLVGNGLIENNRIFTNNEDAIYVSIVTQGHINVIGNQCYDHSGTNDDGIIISDGSGIVADNILYRNWRGIVLVNSELFEVSENSIYENYNTGLLISNTPEVQAVHNLIYENAASGLTSNSERTICSGNTFYRNFYQLYLDAAAKNSLVNNNILWTTGTDQYGIYVVGNPASMNLESNFNCFYIENNANAGRWLGDRKTFFDWQAASGQDGSSLNINPVFADASAGDFHIKSPVGRYLADGSWVADTAGASACLNAGQLYLADSYLDGELNVGATFIDLTDATNFQNATTTIEIDGDIVYYSGKVGNRLNNVTGLWRNHPSGSRVFQPAGSDFTLEPFPNGERTNVGAYGGTIEASLADVKTLAFVEPLGGEEWNGIHTIRWLAVPATEWLPGDNLKLEYSTDGTTFTLLSDLEYPSQQFPDWDTTLVDDGNTYQVRITSFGELTSTSGLFTIDNSAPIDVGSYLPENGTGSLPVYTPLEAYCARDALVGLNSAAYYFQVDTDPAFTAPVSSGWRSLNAWHPDLSSGTVYYWRVKARDKLENESGFCGPVPDIAGYSSFSTSAVYTATNINSVTNGLRWILDNRDLAPGDTVYLNAGFYALTAPLEIEIDQSGNSYYPVRIAATGAGAVLDGGGLIGRCVLLSGNFVVLENVSFTGATDSGLEVSGNNNEIYFCRSYSNPGRGIVFTGNANALVNSLLYGNGTGGIVLDGSEQSRLVNVTLDADGGDEIALSSSPYAYLLNNIVWAQGAGNRCIAVDGSSQAGFSSEYNNLYATSSAAVGYWDGSDRSTLADWRAVSFQDQSSLSDDPIFVGGGDYHPQSQEASYHTGAWTADTFTSPGIDAGDPASPSYSESAPRGGKINLGAYGNTWQASRSYSGGGSLPGINWYLNDNSTANDIYTTHQGSDSYSGQSPAFPFRTFSRLLDENLEPGDTVFVDTGTYQITAPVTIDDGDSGSDAGWVSFAGSRNSSLIDGLLTATNGLRLISGHHLALQSLVLANSADIGSLMSGAYRIRFADNTVSWNGHSMAGTSARGRALQVTGGYDIDIADNLFSHNQTSGIIIEDSPNLALSNNIIRDHPGFWTTIVIDSGIRVTRCDEAELTGNIVFRNSRGVQLQDSDDVSVRQNISYSNDERGFSISGSTLEFSKNISYLNSNYGIYLSACSADEFRNNVSYQNTLRELQISGSTVDQAFNNVLWAVGTGNVVFNVISATIGNLDFNDIIPETGAQVGSWEGTAATTLASWQIACSRDQHSLSLDPLFADPSGVDGTMGGLNGADDDFHPVSTEGSYHFAAWSADTG
ncbi:MAG TPA: right-handed parallel beta-helix repeat-containing protein, partial [bacterium]|nr:right-handed parallel beta-helix repeat-containing protein [bacterium]